MNVAEKYNKAGEKLSRSAGSSIVTEFNQVLTSLLAAPFRVNSGTAVDSTGFKTETVGTIVHTWQDAPEQAGAGEIPVNNVAAVIDSLDSLNIERLREGYQRIVGWKRLKKTVTPSRGVAQTTATLGIIFAVTASISLETIAAEVMTLNETTPGELWPDMVVVLSQGVISYGLQYPGESIAGDFLPPQPGALSRYVPAVYIVPLMVPAGKDTFRKMCSYLIPHLQLYAPTASLADWRKLKIDLPSKGVTLPSYQYDLRGNLKLVPRQYYRERYLPPKPYLIEDDKGITLAATTYLPWQDGGVIMLTGNLTLDGLMIFLLAENPSIRIESVRVGNRQISHVLPITQDNFLRWLARIQNRSNMRVRLSDPEMVVTKMGDEGTTSPFIARLFAGMLKLRDNTINDQNEKEAFDKIFDRIVKGLMNLRTTSQDITSLLSEHRSKVAQGVIAKLRGQTIQIDQNIDVSLEKEVNSFVIGSVRLLKSDMQELAKSIGVDIGFLFQKTNLFNLGVANMQHSDAPLAAYLNSSRLWSERLLDVRNAIEHSGWRLPPIKYKNVSGTIQMDEPQMSGQPVPEFTGFILDRLMCFVEDVVAHCLQRKMPPKICFHEIPKQQRPEEIPERFQVGLVSGILPRWIIYYHATTFAET